MAALPAASLAQSAGDDQYQDPLGGSGDAPSGGGNSGGRNSGAGSGQGGASGGSGSAGDNASSAQAEPSAATPRNQLPRTGVPAGVIALAGGGLLAAGVALRRRVTPRPEL